MKKTTKRKKPLLAQSKYASQDYHAKLTVYGIPAMNEKELQRLIDWLQNLAPSLEKEEPTNYAMVYSARLMKKK